MEYNYRLMMSSNERENVNFITPWLSDLEDDEARTAVNQSGSVKDGADRAVDEDCGNTLNTHTHTIRYSV